jgi:hypothetical protein
LAGWDLTLELPFALCFAFNLEFEFLHCQVYDDVHFLCFPGSGVALEQIVGSLG